MSVLLEDTHFEITLLAEHRDADVEAMLLEHEIRLAERQFEIQQPERRKDWREDCAIHAYAWIGDVDREVQAGLK